MTKREYAVTLWARLIRAPFSLATRQGGVRACALVFPRPNVIRINGRASNRFITGITTRIISARNLTASILRTCTLICYRAHEAGVMAGACLNRSWTDFVGAVRPARTLA